MLTHVNSKTSAHAFAASVICFLIFAVFGGSCPVGGQQPQQPANSFAGATKPPFALAEEAEIKEFDSLPRADRIKRLETEGPLLPKASNLNNFSMRGFVKGQSTFFIDYALEPNSTALVTISTDEQVHELTLLGPKTLRDEVQKIKFLVPARDWKAGAVIIGLEFIITKFLMKPEAAREQVAFNLASGFGDTPQPAKITIQAFSNEPKYGKPAFFRLYGLAMGDLAVANKEIAGRPDALSHHAVTNTLRGQPRASTAFDEIKLTPTTIRTDRSQKVSYEIHSRAGFTGVKVIFHRVEERGDVSLPVVAYATELGPIVENGWLKPRACACQWDGKSAGAASRGIHDVEVRGWLNRDDHDWATARSTPLRVRVY